MTKMRPWLKSGLLILLLPALSYAQTWQPVNPSLNIFNANICATTVTASGTVYAAGEFNNNNIRFVSKWNGTDWVELGTGAASLNANGAILSLAQRGDTVFAAGAFVNGSRKTYVAKWNGSSWSEVGSGAAALNANSNIYSVVADKNGNLYASGLFTNASGKQYVAKWNGTAWAELGTGVNALNANNNIFSIAIDSSNNVYAAGYFTNAAGKAYVAKWNGTSWAELGNTSVSFNANGWISCLAADAAGNIYAGGNITNSSNEFYLAKWNGTAWSETGLGAAALHANSSITSIAIDRANRVYVAGYFNNGSGDKYVARWNGTAWSETTTTYTNTTLNNGILSISVDADYNVYAGGKFLNKSGHAFIAKSNGIGWSEMGWKGDPFYYGQPVSQLVADANGHVYASFTFGSPYIEYWDGKSWLLIQPPDSTGLFITAAGERQMLVGKSGIFYVRGSRRINGAIVDCVLQWDGNKWSVLEDYPNSMGVFHQSPAASLTEIEMDLQGNIYAAGSFMDPNQGTTTSLAKWDGKTWTRLAGAGAPYIVRFCAAGDGNFYAYGDFKDESGWPTIANYNVNRPNGWNTVKSDSTRLTVPGYNVFSALRTDSKNNLYVNGDLINSNGKRFVAKWDGKSWTQVGVASTLGLALEIDANDNIYSNKPSYDYDNPIRKLVGNTWVNAEPQPSVPGIFFTAKLLSIDPLGNIYSDALSEASGVGGYILRLGTAGLPPKLSSFTPASGSVGTAIEIKGKNLLATTAVNFGGVPSSSFIIKNDSIVSAIVARGASGNITLSTKYGTDSLSKFVFTCDSVKGPVPVITAFRDTLLASTPASYYQWFYNGNRLSNQNTDSLHATASGIYRVETSTDGVCWVASANRAVQASQPFSTLILYPNPSNGRLIAYLKLPQPVSGNIAIAVFDVNGNKILERRELINNSNEIKTPVVVYGKGRFVIKIVVNDIIYQQSAIVL